MNRKPLDLAAVAGSLALAAYAWLQPVATAAAGSVSSAPGTKSADPNTVRVGLLRATLPVMNERDALAAMKVWFDVIARERNLGVTAEPKLFQDAEPLKKALKLGEVDIVVLPPEVLLDVGDLVSQDTMFAASTGEDLTERYVVLVRGDGGPPSLRDLRGKQLLVHRENPSSLITKWLDVRLADRTLPRADRFFGQVDYCEKPLQAMLPVFFGKAAACVARRATYDAAVVLNPQLGNVLKVIETSPMVVSAVVCFRRSYAHPSRGGFAESMTSLDRHEQGRQVLMFFRADRVRRITPAALDATRELLARYQKLVATTAADTEN